MKRIKRFAALLLALLMLMPPTGVYAEGVTETGDPIQTEGAAPQETAPAPEGPPAEEPSAEEGPPAEEPPASEPPAGGAPVEEPPVDEPAVEEPPAIAVSSVEVTADGDAAYVIIGESLQLAALVLPEDAGDRAVTWSTDDEAIATVDGNGLVTALAAGDFTVTAAAGNGVSGSIALTARELTLTERLARGGEYTYEADLALGEDLTVPEGAALTLGGKLTVPAGRLLTVNGSLRIAVQADIAGTLAITETGAVTVEKGASIKVLAADPAEDDNGAPIPNGAATNLGRLDVYGTLDFADGTAFTEGSLPATVYDTGAVTGSELFILAAPPAEEPGLKPLSDPTPITTIALLKAAMDGAQTGQSFELAGPLTGDVAGTPVNITIPQGVTLNTAGYDISTGATIVLTVAGTLNIGPDSELVASTTFTVNSGATVNIDGQLSSAGTFDLGGTLTNRGFLSNRGTFNAAASAVIDLYGTFWNATGAEASLAEGAVFNQHQPGGRVDNEGVFGTNGQDVVVSTTYVSNAGDLRIALEDWRVTRIRIENGITVYDGMNIPRDKRVDVEASGVLTISNAWNNCFISIEPDAMLNFYEGSGFVLEEGGIAYNFGYVYLEAGVNVTQAGIFYGRGGTVTGEGSAAVTVTEWTSATAGTFAALKTAIETGRKNSVTLSASITIPNGKSIDMPQYTNIVIPQGKTLTVAASGSLAVGANCTVRAERGGTLTNNGTVVLGGGALESNGGTINNKGALDGGNGSVGLYSYWDEAAQQLAGSVFNCTNDAVTGNLQLSANSRLNISGSFSEFSIENYANINGAVTVTGSMFYIGEFGSVDCFGSITLSQSALLEIDGGLALMAVDAEEPIRGAVTFTDVGTLIIGDNGWLENNGVLTLTDRVAVIQSGIYHTGPDGSLTDPHGFLTDNKRASSDYDALVAALADANVRQVVVEGEATLGGDLTVPAGKRLIVSPLATLEVPQGKTLSLAFDQEYPENSGILINDGTVTVSGTLENGGYIQNNRVMSFDSDSVLDIYGPFNNQGVVALLADNVTVRQHEPNGKFTNGGTGFIDPANTTLIIPTEAHVTTMAELTARLGDWRVETVVLDASLEADGAITVPRDKGLTVTTDATLTVSSELTVSQGASLQVHGAMALGAGPSPAPFSNYGYTAVLGRLDMGDMAFFNNFGDMVLDNPGETVFTCSSLAENFGQIYLNSGTALFSGSGAMFSVGGSMIVRHDAELSFANGAALYYASEGERLIKNMGTVRFDGTVTVHMEGGTFINRSDLGAQLIDPPESLIVSGGKEVSTFAQLKAALKNSSVAEVYIVSPFSMTENLTVSSGVTAYIDCSGSFIVPAGKKLTVSAGASLYVNAGYEGTEYSNLLNRGTIVNNGMINVMGRLDNVGTFTSGEDSVLIAGQGGDSFGCITGSGKMGLNDLELTGDGLNGAEFSVNDGGRVTVRGTVNMNGFSSMYVWGGSFALEGTEERYAGMGIGDMASLYLVDGATFTSNEFSWIDCYGTINVMDNECSITIGGSFLNEGVIGGSGAARLSAMVNSYRVDSFDALESALGQAGTKQVTLAGDIDVTGNLTVPDGMQVIVNGPNVLCVKTGATLTVAPGGIITLERNYEDPFGNDGQLNVESGGALSLSGGISMPTGILQNGGALTTLAGSWIDTQPYARIENTGTFDHGGFMSITESTLNTSGGTFNVTGVIVADNAVLELGGATNISSGGVAVFGNNGAVTVQSTLTLSGDGRLELADGAHINASGGTVVRSDDGALAVLVNSNVSVSGVDNSLLTAVFHAGDERELAAAANDRSYLDYYNREIWLRNSANPTVTLTRDLTIPAGFELALADEVDAFSDVYRGTTLVVPQGVMLTNEGKIAIMSSVTEDGSAWEYCSELNVAGCLRNDGTIAVYGKLTLVGTGRYEGKAASVRFNRGIPGIVSPGIENNAAGVAVEEVHVGHEMNMHVLPAAPFEYSFTATVLPANAEDKGVTWSIVNESGSPITVPGVSIAPDGSLSVNAAAVVGTVFCVQAASNASPTVKDSFRIELSARPIKLSYEGDTDSSMTAPIVVYSGESVELSTVFAPGEEPGFGIAYWLANSESERFASLDPNTGVLTAKAVTMDETITVAAQPSISRPEAYSASRTVIIRPNLAGVAITNYNDTVSGTVMRINLNDMPEYITFRASPDPWEEDERVTCTWALEEREQDNTLVFGTSVSLEDDRICTVSPRGVSSPDAFTLTCTATDGVNNTQKSSSVTVEFSYMASGVTIANKDLTPLPETPIVIAGGYLALGTVFEGENLVNRKVAWSLRPEDAACATISAAGRLAAKATVTTSTVVEATVKALDGSGRADTRQITIIPRAASLSITSSDFLFNYTGTTVCVDSSAIRLLSARVYPLDAPQDVAWSWVDKKGIATLTVDPVGNLLIEPVAGKAGTLTVTAKATDGSGKAAKVTVKTGSFIHDVTFPEDNTVPMLAGTSRQLSYSISIPEAPTNSSCVWSVAPQSRAYATVTAAGLLKLKANIYSPTEVHLILTAKDTGSTFECIIPVMPVTALVIKDAVSDDDYTGTTRFIDLAGGSVTLKMDRSTPFGPELADLTWSVPANTVLSKSIDPGTNQLTLTALKAGTVTITAKAKMAGVASTATVKVTVRDPITAIEIRQPAAATQSGGSIPLNFVAAGKTLQLSAYLTTAAGVKLGTKLVDWSIEGYMAEDAATISAAGKLTAKPNQLYRTIVTVRATARDGSGISGTADIAVHPAATAVAIGQMDNGSFVNRTSQTIEIDRNDAPLEWQLTARVIPFMDGAELAKATVLWKSSNTKLVQVDDTGKLTPGMSFAKGGTVTITATTTDGTKKSASLKVRIVEKVTELTIDMPSGTPTDLFGWPVVTSGKSIKLSPNFGNTTPSNKKVQWFMEDGKSSVATLSAAGVLKAKAITQPTSVIIWCRALDGSEFQSTAPMVVQLYPATTSLVIHEDEHTGELLNGRTLLLDVGDSAFVKVSALPALSAINVNAANLKVSDKPAIADCELESAVYGSFRINANAPGTATVSFTATDGSGKKASFTVKVARLTEDVVVSGPFQVARGKGVQLKALCTSTAGTPTNGKVVWSMDPSYKAKFTLTSTGKLTAKAAAAIGDKVTVRATAADGGGACTDYELTVTAPVTSVQIYSGLDRLTGSTRSLARGSDITLTARTLPDAASGQVTWKCSVASAQVSVAGNTINVTMPDNLAIGKTITLTATAADGSGKYATVKLKCTASNA